MGKLICRGSMQYILMKTPGLRAFLHGYFSKVTPHAGFNLRFRVYMLLDRAIIWEFVHRHDPACWNGSQTFRDWASYYLAISAANVL